MSATLILIWGARQEGATWVGVPRLTFKPDSKRALLVHVSWTQWRSIASLLVLIAHDTGPTLLHVGSEPCWPAKDRGWARVT